MKFVIDRKTWRRGGEVGNLKFGKTYLLNERGYQCCLGQIALQCNVPKEVLLNRCIPSEVPLQYLDYRALFPGFGFSDRAMAINDSIIYSETGREQRLIKLFAEHGHELEFVS